MCREHTEADALASQGMILAAMEALLKGDDESIKGAFSVFTPYDTHVAVTLLTAAYEELCVMSRLPLPVFLGMMRKRVNELQAKAAS